VDLGVAPDQPEALRQLLEQALEAEPDLILSSGGVSVGDRDLVKSLLGDGLDFWRVRVKPGKPLAAGRVRGRPMVGLPGNPVSAALNFLQFIRPGLRMALGDPTPYLPVVEARLQRGLRRAPGREELLRAQVWREGAGWAAEALGWQGSAHQRGLVGAEGLLLFARESNGAEAGDLLPVQLIAGQLPGSTEPGYRWGGRILA
jgi:molybdopterin molybdotransferase